MAFLSSGGNNIPNVEFTSLSLLGEDPSFCSITVMSPLITTPTDEMKQSIVDLHTHLLLLDSHVQSPPSSSNHNSTTTTTKEQKSSPSTTPRRQNIDNHQGGAEEASTPQMRNGNGTTWKEESQKEETAVLFDDLLIHQLAMRDHPSLNRNLENQIQRFQPSSGGLTMLYQVLMDMSSSTINTLFGITPSQKDSNKKHPSYHHKALLCVGIQGDYFQLYPQLDDRILKCVKWLRSYNKPTNKSIIADLSRKLNIALTSVLFDDDSIQISESFQNNNNDGDSTSFNFGGNNMIMNSGDKNFMMKAANNFKNQKPSNVARVLFMKKKNKKSKYNDWKDNSSLSSCFKSISSVGLPSSDVARIIAEQLQVLSLAEYDMEHLRKYNNINNKLSNNRKKGGGYARSPNRGSRKQIMNHFSMRNCSEGSDLSGFDYHPPHYYQQQQQNTNSMQQSMSSISSRTITTASISDSVSVSADSLTAFSVKSFGGNSTSSFSSTPSSALSSASIPTLVGSSRDSNLSKKDFRKNRILAASQKKSSIQQNSLVLSHKQSPKYGFLSNQASMVQFRQNKDSDRHLLSPNRSQHKSTIEEGKIYSQSWASGKQRVEDSTIFDPFSFQEDKLGSPQRSDSSHKSSNSTRHLAASTTSSHSDNADGEHQLTRLSTDGNTELFGKNMWPSPMKSKESALEGQEKPELFVNIALNEDLTCSYRNSKISSCSIEGMMQAQLLSNSSQFVPFTLHINDPSKHIKTIQGNASYVEDATSQLRETNNETKQNHKYIVTIPKIENYFPILRYKCSNELRPVPIRVQTRVRIHETFCRVALQISSNPANADDLTDLTIIMAVPKTIKGETLVSSPAGGVWNEGKRSVVWCVAEVGIGQKFQLQAQFEMESAIDKTSDENLPSFPVLVRCQCMSTQLSNIQFDVSEVPKIFPSNVMMKMARRFRISHRER